MKIAIHCIEILREIQDPIAAGPRHLTPLVAAGWSLSGRRRVVRYAIPLARLHQVIDITRRRAFAVQVDDQLDLSGSPSETV